MRKLVVVKIFILISLLICTVSQIEARTIYVSTGGGGNGSSSGAPTNMAGFLTAFKAHKIADGATFYAYFKPGEYTLTETLTLASNQAGVLFVLDKEPDTEGTVIFKPQSATTDVGVFKSTAQTAGTGGCNITFRNITFTGFRGATISLGGNAGYRVFSIIHNANVLTLDHVTIRNCNHTTTTNNRSSDLISMAHSETYFHVFVSEINIFNSSIINNTRSSGSSITATNSAKICNIRNGNARIYNTTFSDNKAWNVAYADFYNTTSFYVRNLSRGYIAFANNTVYNSGTAVLDSTTTTSSWSVDNRGAGKGLFMNNIFAGGSTIPAAGTGTNYTNRKIADVCFNNIIASNPNGTYYATGITTGTLISNFTDYFNISADLDSLEQGGYGVSGSQHRGLRSVNVTSPLHPIRDKDNNLDEVGFRVWDTEGFSNLSYDQLGNSRAQSRRAIGAIDVGGFGVLNGDVRIYYNSHPEAANQIPEPKTIDLSKYVISYPGNLSKSSGTTFTITNTSALQSGTSLSAVSGIYNIVFYPKTSGSYSGEGSFTFKVSGTVNGLPYEETATVRVQVIDLNLSGLGGSNLPGYGGEVGIGENCKIEMKPVEFNPLYKFVSGEFVPGLVSGSAYNNITVANGDSLAQVYDYHIPLVGDLNGDGRPEIVALGMNRTFAGYSSNTNYDITVNAIHLFNGQTGEQLLSHLVPSFKPFGDGYHGSPGSMALIDSDRDGDVEAILAVGAHATSTISKRLHSYKIHYNKGTDTWSIVSNPKWGNYNTSFGDDNADTPDFSTPLIQIVDFNKDGKPEILAYNKIFDAETGQKLLTYETLNSDPQTAGSAYVGRDFRGRESFSKDHLGNSKIGFASVYDLDGDGKYEICAGGKVYYNINIDNGTYSVLNIMGTGKLPTNQRLWLEGNGLAEPNVNAIRSFTDGRTAVADIDGDGKAEIVASYYVESNFHYDVNQSTTTTGEYHDHGSANKLRIVAWNVNLDTIAPTNPTVELKAILNIPLSNYGTSGTYSYMYIADVDGREQNDQKLPEISMLGPMFYCYLYGNSWTGYPIHPNVADSMAVSYPRTGGPTEGSRARGTLISFTWDNTPGLSVFDRLKVSFMMEHSDESVNTGISLFDFDNDGKNEICYRDETTLRIIKPTKPFVALGDTDPNVTIFRSNVTSNTGFEYPVIVDLDGDYSGDMLVSGNTAGKKSTRDFLYAIQGANVDLAPARTVWNQFMYSPLKVTDRLTVPHKDSIPPHPLSPAAAFYKTASDKYETYLYNMNIGQVPYFSVSNSGGKSVYAPLVKIANAVLSDLKFKSGSPNRDTIIFVISNAGEAAINANTPIKIYKGENASSAAIYKDTIVGSAVYPGESVTIKVPLKAQSDNAETFLVRVSDDSFEGAKGDVFSKAESSFADCEWPNNWDVLSYYYLRGDYYTVLPGETVILDVLKNDILTHFGTPHGKTINDFTVTTLTGGSPALAKVSQKLQFTAPATGGLHCYKYTYTAQPQLPSTGYIHIYVAELEAPNTLLCNGQSYTLKVKPLPGSATFRYYESDSVTLINGEPTFTASVSKPDTSFFVKPHSGILTNYPTLNFDVGDYLPAKRIRFKVTPTAGAQITLRWTGLKDTNWHDPKNWEALDATGKKGSAVTYYPSACANVIIPAGAANYPMLTADAYCDTITMGDRAMLAGIHYLTYEAAKVEIKLTADERDRFVMWSAPLKSMYSGDYHFKDGTTPKWGDIYMNLFQAPSPDGSATDGVKYSFTATFGNLGTPLSLGKAFNLKVTTTAANKDKSFVFPQTATSYTDAKGAVHPTTRGTNGSRFILDRKDGLSHFLPVVNDAEGSTLIQVVNPYMAYLSVSSLLGTNSAVLRDDGYAIWDGSLGGFAVHATVGDINNRFEVTTVPTMGDPLGLIPPLQSFFVEKKSQAKLTASLMINPGWTYTNSVNPYKLRAGEQETNVLRIKAVQGKAVDYAVLHYNASTSPAYNGQEDKHKLFYQLEEGVTPLEVYSFAPTKEALAINSSSDFTQNVPLGLRTGTAGTVTLEFSGMATFGHNVYLIDHAQNNKETDLQKTPSYTFTVAKKQQADKMIELNDRFSLRTSFTGKGVGNEATGAAELNVTSKDGYIYVQTPSLASSLQVYNLTGALVYSSATRSDYFRIQTDRQQAYIVKVKINEEYLTQKVFVK